MTVSGESIYISSKSGKKKNGESWFMAKFLDDNSDEFFVIFITDSVFNELQKMPKKTPVLLTIEMIPGKNFVEFISIEIIKTK